MTTTTEPEVLDSTYAVPIEAIDPDPAQPRLEVDDELSASIKEHGVLKAIEVRPHPEQPDRFMIVDGERRWRGSKKAGLKKIPVVFATNPDVVGISDAKRLVRQLVYNAGKPLTPVELGFAYQRIIDEVRRGDPEYIDRAKATEAERRATNPGEPIVRYTGGKKDYGPVQLAREIGVAKSTVTDALAITQIPRFWLKFITNGPLQASHVPALHRIRQMPEKYQLRVLTRLQDDSHWPVSQGGTSHSGRAKTVERIRVDDFQDALTDALGPFVRPLKDVGAAYKGPTAKLKPRGYYAKEMVFAIDPHQWEPILRKKRAEKTKKTRDAGGRAAVQQRENAKWAKQREENDRRQAAEQRQRQQYKAALPEIYAAIAVAIGKASLKQLEAGVLEANLHGAKSDSKRAAKFVAQGTTAEQFLRHVCMIAALIDGDWQIVNDVQKTCRRWGVDLGAIMKAAKKGEDEPTASATLDAGSGKGARTVKKTAAGPTDAIAQGEAQLAADDVEDDDDEIEAGE